MSGIDLVASFNAQLLVADKYLQNQAPDRSEETQRNVEEGDLGLMSKDGTGFGWCAGIRAS